MKEANANETESFTFKYPSVFLKLAVLKESHGLKSVPS